MINYLKNIAIYSICIVIYSVILFFIINSIMNISMHYLIIAIPLLLLVLILAINNVIKMLSILCLLPMENKGELVEKLIKKTNKLTTYSVIGIFLSLLTSVIILDIIICFKIKNYILIIIAIIVWLFTLISVIKSIKVFIKEKIQSE